MYLNKPEVETLPKGNSNQLSPKEIIQITRRKIEPPKASEVREVAMAQDSPGGSWQQASQRPLALTFREDE